VSDNNDQRASAADIDPGAQLKKVARGAKEKRFLLLMLTTVGLILGAFVATLVPDLYESKSLLLVRERQLIQNSSIIRAIEDKSLAQKEQTLAQELRSFVWVKEVLEELQWPDFLEVSNDAAEVSKYVDKVRDPKYFEIIMDTDAAGELLMKIVFRWFDPERAAAFVTQTRTHWIDSREEDNLKYHKQFLRELSEQLKTAQEEYNVASSALERFQQTNGVFEVQSSADGDVQLKTSLQRELSTLDAEIVELEEHVRSLELDLSKQEPDRVEVVTTVDQQFGAAQARLLSAKTHYENELATKTERNPLVIEAKKRFEEALADFNMVQGNASLPSSTRTVSNPEFDRLSSEISSRRAELRGKERNRISRNALLQDVTARLERRPGLDSGLRKLKNEEQLKLEILNDIRAQMVPYELKVRSLESRSGIFKSADGESSNAYEFLEEAVVANSPTGLPKFLFSLIGALVFLAAGLAGVTFWQMTRSTLDTVDDVQRAFSLPILGAIGRIATAAEVRSARIAALGSTLGALLIVGSLGYLVYLVTMQPEQLPQEMQAKLAELKDTFR